MSRHYVHKFKYSHERRRHYFNQLINQGRATIVEHGRCFFVVDTGQVNYRISRKGRVVKVSPNVPTPKTHSP